VISIDRDGTKVRVRVAGRHPVGGYTWTLHSEQGNDSDALMLAHNLAGNLFDQLQRIRREAYQQGWEDKKKRRPEKSWFSGRWE
jgi:hypothetical protein